MVPDSGAGQADRLDDHDYPAYTMGRAAELIGATPAFLRAIGDAGLITPERSEGGHRRYSRSHLRVALRARELVDQGTAIDTACRIISLEDRLAGALRINEELRRSGGTADTAPGTPSDTPPDTPPGTPPDVPLDTVSDAAPEMAWHAPAETKNLQRPREKFARRPR